MQLDFNASQVLFGEDLALTSGTTGGGKMNAISVATDGSVKVDATVSVDVELGGTAYPFSGTATDAVSSCAFTATCNSIFLNNLSTANNMLYSFEATTGGTFLTMPPEASATFQCNAGHIQLKCTTGLTAAYEALAIVP